MADEDDEQWRFSVDEVGPDDPEESTGTADSVPGDQGEESDGWSVTLVGEDDDGPTVGVATDDADEGEEGGNVAGDIVPDAPVEPGTPNLENVVFTAAGAILTALIFAGVLVSLDPATVGAIAGTIAAGAALLYVLFRRF